MSKFHAVVWIDHHQAHIHEFDAEHALLRELRAHTRDTGQHHSEVRTQHEFFGQVCDALNDIPEMLVTGGHMAQADFKRYLEKHRPALASRIVGWETVDHPSDGQLVAAARKFFVAHDRWVGRPTPT